LLSLGLQDQETALPQVLLFGAAPPPAGGAVRALARAWRARAAFVWVPPEHSSPYEYFGLDPAGAVAAEAAAGAGGFAVAAARLVDIAAGGLESVVSRAHGDGMAAVTVCSSSRESRRPILTRHVLSTGTSLSSATPRRAAPPTATPRSRACSRRGTRVAPVE